MTENSAITAYFNKLAKIKLLTKDEERELFRRISQGDASARNEIIEHNLRLVIPTAKAYAKCGIGFSDLIQEGSIGLANACDKFDVSLGNKFSTYATGWIRQRIGRYVKKHCKNVFVPEHVVNLAVQINKAKRLLAQDGNSEPGVDDIVTTLKTEFDIDADKDAVRNAIESCQSETSLFAKVGNDGETELGDLLEDESANDPTTELDSSSVNSILHSVSSVLTADEKKILLCRYGFGIPEKGLSVSEISSMFGIPEDDVRAIAGTCLRKLTTDECELGSFAA